MIKEFIVSLWYEYQSWRFERKCMKHLGMKPTKIYLSQEDYDALVTRLDEPVDIEAQEKIRKVLERIPPWERKE